MNVGTFCRRIGLFLFLSLFFITFVQAEERLARERSLLGEVSLSGRIVELNETYRFAVINLGTVDGVKKGMIFNVFQRDEEVAKLKVSKVRRHISACDIQLVYTGRGIGVGDLVIFKETPPIVKMFKPLEPTRMIEVEPIVVDIDAPKRTILLKVLTVFKEFGTMITRSDPKAYTIKAQKNLDMPLLQDLLTEWGPYTRNKVFYTAEVTTTPGYNRLIIRLRGVYDKAGQLYNYELKKTAPVYKEAQEMAFTIKDLAEEL